jgi:BirA family transcriptional regulator, biotin operon repressor / biotin---[acetyl-CoA-carboxylase] ligase
MGETTLRGLKKVRMVTERIGHEVLWVRRTDSTNDLAWREAERGCEDGTLILAEEQAAGRGRHGRTWFSLPERGILCSVVLRPALPVEKASLITVCGALAVRDVAAGLTAVPAVIRWPNDVLLGGRKVAGVLVESRTIAGGADPVYVLGIGMNVNMKEEDFPEEIRAEATSLDLAARRHVDRLEAARELVESLDGWYLRLRSGRTESIAAAWRESSAVLRKRVEVVAGGETHRGTVEDLDPVEGIFLRVDRGGILRLRSEHVERLRLMD